MSPRLTSNNTGALPSNYQLFAISWESLVLDEHRKCFILDVDKSQLENAPGFDKSNWPEMTETSWGDGVHKYWTGIGDYGMEAGRRYDCASAAIPKRDIEQKAQEAREAIDGPEGDSLRRAEQIAKERSKADKLE
jgi:hypothetical protein